VVAFAQSLFDEPFEWVEPNADRQDVVEAERIQLEALGEPWGEPDPDLYHALQQMLEGETVPSSSQAAAIAREHGVPEKVVAEACNA
jgi:hypothetical protein